MAKKKQPPPENLVPITANRANRLYQFVSLLGQKKQRREQLTKKLKVGVRDFYRDLETLRKVGINIIQAEGQYSLDGSVAEAVALLPFPDPLLTLGEAKILAQGQTPTHKKLRERVAAFEQLSTTKSGKGKKS
jgi:hypothetical protein